MNDPDWLKADIEADERLRKLKAETSGARFVAGTGADSRWRAAAYNDDAAARYRRLLAEYRRLLPREPGPEGGAS